MNSRDKQRLREYPDGDQEGEADAHKMAVPRPTGQGGETADLVTDPPLCLTR